MQSSLELRFFTILHQLSDAPAKLKLTALFRIADNLFEKDPKPEEGEYTYILSEALSEEEFGFLTSDAKKGFLLPLCIFLIKGSYLEPFYTTPHDYETVEFKSYLTEKGKTDLRNDWMNTMSYANPYSVEQKEKTFHLLEEHLGITTWLHMQWNSELPIRLLPPIDSLLESICTLLDPPLTTTAATSFAELKRKIEQSNYVGETLREYRKAKGLNQEQAANLVGVTQAQWSAYELGKTRMNLDVIVVVCMSLEIDIMEFVKKCFEKLPNME